MSSHAPAEAPQSATASGPTVGCLLAAAASAVLMVLARLTLDLTVSTTAVAALAATTVVALWAATGTVRPGPARVVSGIAAGAAGLGALLALADRPVGVVVPIGSLVLAAVVLRSRRLLGAAVLLAMVSVVVLT